MSYSNEALYKWAFGSARFDEATLALTIADERVRIEPKPLRILSLLLRHAGEIVTREEILESVWDGRATVEHSIATALGKLRRALAAEPGVRIETIPRVGYRLTGDLHRIAVGGLTRNRLQLEKGQSVRGQESRYVLDQQIGSTASSDVWLARAHAGRQGQVLKFALDGSRLARLKHEAAIHRHLRRTLPQRRDINRLSDTNFSEPPFFLACEYGGSNLQTWFESRSDAGHGISRRLILDLFVRSCDAVAAAHGVGVLHRDIKPENILIAENEAGELELKLADFGSSELLDGGGLEKLRLTHSGVRLTVDDPGNSGGGTALYLAPELLSTGTATIRSDIYALGVVLYQMLTGRFGAMLTPGWERALDDPLLIEDIKTATDQDPARRISSVDELAERIRSLEQRRATYIETRDARQQFERLRQAAEVQRARRPWVVGAMLSLALGLAASLFLYGEAESERREALRFAESMQAVQRFLSDDIIRRGGLINVIQASESRFDVLLSDVARQIDHRFADQPLAAAGLHQTFGNLFSSFRADQKAVEQIESAIKLYTAELGPGHALALQSRYELGLALSRSGRYGRSRTVLEQADALAAQSSPLDPSVEINRAYAYGALHAGLHDDATAHDYFVDARRILKRAAIEDADLKARIDAAIVDVLIRIDRPDEALVLLDQIEQLDQERLGIDIPAIGARNRARAYRGLGQYSKALEQAHVALEKSTQAFGPEHYQTILSWSLIAQLQSLLKDCDGTLQTSTQVHQLMSDAYGPDASSTLIEYGNLGAKQFECGMQEQGAAKMRQTIAGLEQQYGTQNRAAHQFRFILAKFFQKAGHDDLALTELDYLRALIAQQQADGAPPSLPPARVLLHLARSKAVQGRTAEAVADLESARNSLDGQEQELTKLIDQALAQIIQS
jgi:non-specific serine/threonine protein kinase